jgi:hypothetical protein
VWRNGGFKVPAMDAELSEEGKNASVSELWSNPAYAARVSSRKRLSWMIKRQLGSNDALGIAKRNPQY